MAVVSVAEEASSPKGGQSENKGYWFERTFIVLTNDLADGPGVVKNATGIPQIFDLYVFGNEFDIDARCRDVNAERLAPRSFQWKVTARYEQPDIKEQAQQFVNPLLELPEIQVTSEKFQVVADKDIGSQAIATSADEPYDPPVQKDSSRLIITIRRNEDITTPHPDIWYNYADKVNSDTFFGFGPTSCKINAINVTRKLKNLQDGTPFYYLEAEYVIEVHPDSWDEDLLDAGTFYKDSHGNKVAFITSDGHPYVGLLNGAGQKLPDGGAPVYNNYEIYNRIAFSGLNLPQSFAQGQ